MNEAELIKNSFAYAKRLRENLERSQGCAIAYNLFIFKNDGTF